MLEAAEQTKPGPRSWFEKLTPAQQKEVEEIRAAMAESGLPMTVIAVALKKEAEQVWGAKIPSTKAVVRYLSERP